MAEDKIKIILATDCGSTTTKAILIEKKEGEYRLTFRGEAPTTVEAPFEDVTRGVINAIVELEELSGKKILDVGFGDCRNLLFFLDLEFNDLSGEHMVFFFFIVLALALTEQ